MQTANTNIRDFLQANKQTRVFSLIPHMVQAGQTGLALLSEIAQFDTLTLEDAADMSVIKSSCLPWYKPNEQGYADWYIAGCKNYTVAEYADSIQRGETQNEDVKELKGSLEQGLCQDIVLVRVFDTTLNKGVIVDGCKRAVALALIAQQNKDDFSKLMNSDFSITIIELRSRLAHCLYPCDFLLLSWGC